MILENRAVGRLRELRAVAVACRKCPAVVRVALGSLHADALQTCPACGTKWLPNDHAALSELLAALKQLQGAEYSIVFGSRTVRVLFEFDAKESSDG